MKESLAARLTSVYNMLAAEMSPKVKSVTTCRLVAKKLIRDNISLRRRAVAEFFSNVRGIMGRTLTLTLLTMENIQLHQSLSILTPHTRCQLL